MTLTIKKAGCGLAVTVLLVCIAAAGPEQSTNSHEAKVGAYTLPDPLVFNNGKRVQTRHDWKHRREEILELFQKNVFGHSPRAGQRSEHQNFDINKNWFGGKAIRKQVTIDFSAKRDGPKADLPLYTPAGARKPVPMILTLNFS